MRILESDSLKLLELKALGSVCVSAETGSFEAIFDADYINVEGVNEQGPALTCRSCDVDRLSIRNGTVLEVNGKDYRVRTPEPDGTGMTVLRLGAL
jgi:hypothetical protein